MVLLFYIETNSGHLLKNRKFILHIQKHSLNLYVMGSFLKIIKSTTGVSVMEVMAAVLASSVGMISAYKVYENSLQKSIIDGTEPISCEAYQEAIFSNLRKMGAKDNFQEMPAADPDTNNLVGPLLEFGHDTNIRWKTNPVDLWEVTTPREYRSPYLYIGHMNALLSALKSDTNMCAGLVNPANVAITNNGPGSSLFFETDVPGMTGVSHTVKISPYLLAAPGTEDCSNLATMVLAPTGLAQAPPDGGLPIMHADVETTKGLRVTLKTVHDLGDCESTREFTFPEESTNPPDPTINETASPAGVVRCDTGTAVHPSVPAARAQAGVSGQSITIELGYQIAGYKPSSILVCRDRSLSYIGIENPLGNPEWDNVPVQGPGLAACGSNPAGGAGSQVYYTCPPWDKECTQLNAAVGTIVNPGRYSGDDDNFYPCNALSVCGVAPAAAPFLTKDPTGFHYAATYDHLPFGCQIEVDVAVMDGAGNYSQVVEYGAAPKIVLPKIPYPTCGANDPATTPATHADHWCEDSAAPGTQPGSGYVYDFSVTGGLPSLGYYKCDPWAPCPHENNPSP